MELGVDQAGLLRQMRSKQAGAEAAVLLSASTLLLLSCARGDLVVRIVPMTREWTQEAVLALAPDADSAKAGKGLASRDRWVTPGREE